MAVGVAAAVTGHVLDHRQAAARREAVRHRTAIARNELRIGREGAIADHRVERPTLLPVSHRSRRGDGVASWWCCVDEVQPETENVEVRGSHIGLLHNPLVLYVIADRLAQPEGEWQPFAPSGLPKLLYRGQSE